MIHLFRSGKRLEHPRIPGVPQGFQLGASRNEALALLVALVVLVSLFGAAWWSAAH
jgi:hypothetical protein